jgi:tetraacyldisaccharide 4'-kinase
LYDRKLIRSATFGLPLISVGNLAVGGTGKSPMVEYLVSLLKSRYSVATLSRGYRRRTKGYALANKESTALDIGDEPLALYRKFPTIPVAVGEERLLAIPELLHDRPEVQVIILDDAFQHRTIEAGFNILLTDYNNLFTRDFYLPTGDLRDLKRRYKEAEIIIVTKCKEDLSDHEKSRLIHEIKPVEGQHIFFTKLAYGKPYHLLTKTPLVISSQQEVLLVTGISNPVPLKKWVEDQTKSYQLLQYRDHHIFTVEDLRDIKKEFTKLGSQNSIILTTEKDAVRLEKFAEDIKELPFYVVPVQHEFLFDEQSVFDQMVISFIDNFERPFNTYGQEKR